MKKRGLNTLLSVLILAFNGQILGQNLNDISFGTDSTFEVITWNIESFPKNGSITVDSVSEIITSLNADLIGIQEIDDTAACRQMINNMPGYQLFIDSGWFGGLVYVYKTNTINVHTIYEIYDTQPYWNIFPRAPLVMELSFMGEDFVVINNHFKCCGDGIIDMGNTSDEEFRRYEASSLLKQYIDTNFPLSQVIVIGDLNDLITDIDSNNVFQMFLNDSMNYLFADDSIANGASTEWSFPGWPSHLDHILITNELFTEFSNPGSEIRTIKVDDFMSGGLASYNMYISDHRPVGLKLNVNETSLNLVKASNAKLKIYPNPTKGKLSVDLTGNKYPAKVEITNLQGELIHTSHHKGNQIINLNFEAVSGMYILNVESANHKSRVRFIKK